MIIVIILIMYILFFIVVIYCFYLFCIPFSFFVFVFYLFSRAGCTICSRAVRTANNKKVALLLLLLLLLFAVGHCFEFFISGRKFEIYSPQYNTQVVSDPTHPSINLAVTPPSARTKAACTQAYRPLTSTEREVTKSGCFPSIPVA